jgi:pilus assembly protein Flp/PilA
MGEADRELSRIRICAMLKHFARFIADTRGATAVEYGLICALIALVLISALTLLGPTIETQFMNINTAISAPTP